MNLMILLRSIGGCDGGLGFPQPHRGDLSRVSAGYLYSGV